MLLTTGSSSVQVALLTENIRQLTEHCKKFPKDVSTHHGLLQMVCDRRTFLKYIAKKTMLLIKQLLVA